jgi:hypothetical protein
VIIMIDEKHEPVLLTAAQRDLLDSLISESGIYIEVIKENTTFDLGTKVLYLERAISQNCHTFLRSLDKLYSLNQSEEDKVANIEFLRALKTINDLCFNNMVKYGHFGTRRALMHFFASLGLEHVKPANFQKMIVQIIQERISELYRDNKETIVVQLEARKSDEAAIEKNAIWREQAGLPSVGEAGWRQKLDLPAEQLCQLTLVEIEILGQLEQYGLTALHLQGKRLNVRHIHVLHYLFTEKNMNAEQAMAEIKGFEYDISPALRIPQGITRAEILQLGVTGYSTLHVLRIDAYLIGKPYGMTIQDAQGMGWSLYHVQALKYLLEQRKMGVGQAIKELEGLMWYQCEKIAKGATREEVLQLDDPRLVRIGVSL